MGKIFLNCIVSLKGDYVIGVGGSWIVALALPWLEVHAFVPVDSIKIEQ